MAASLLVRAQDWPMWGYDAARTAVAPEALPATLRLHWIQELDPPAPAWPATQTKLQFDAAYSPVVQGRTIYVPSMAADRLTAYDTRTGWERWRFYADGPIRLAPVAFADKVAFVSDDGHLYCLHAADGSLAWKLRGGPADRRVLGNERLISMWPARGGPVIQDGTLYFAASIWPFMGTFIHAVDAETGQAVWSNTGSGSSYQNQQHNSPAFAGVAPQGYFTLKDDILLVSGGRSVPAAYDRTTGKFLYYHVSSRQFGKNAGGYGVTAVGDCFINGQAIYDLKTGTGLAPVAPGIATEDTYYTCDGAVLTAWALPPVVTETRDRKGKKTKKVKLEKRWEAALQPAPDRLEMIAGHRLYGSKKDGTILAVDLAGAGHAQVSWQARVEGTPAGMLAADRRLYVTTREGRLYCYGKARGKARTFVRQPLNPAPAPGGWTQKARQILDVSGAPKGYGVCLGIGSGHLIHELLRQSDLHWLVVDPDPDRVKAFRVWLDRLGYYGRRVAVLPGDPGSFPFPPYLASLLVSEDLDATGWTSRNTDPATFFEVLRPYGGMALFADTKAAADPLRAWERDAAAQGFEISRADGWIQIRRPGPLEGAGRWTHQYADAANTVVSEDRRVKTPLGLLWFGGPSHDDVLPRHGHGPTPQVVGGRLFIEGPDMLRAVDVYTGRLLWQRDLPGIGKFYDNTSHQPGANEIGGNYVSVEDGIYVLSPQSCQRLDPATGQTLSEFTLPAPPGEPAPKWGSVAVWKDLLVATASPMSVAVPKAKEGNHPEENLHPILTDPQEWQYLAGSHPEDAWTTLGFDDSGWDLGSAGFGYEDDDDATELDDMKGNYSVVYLRQVFNVDKVQAFPELQLGVLFDDAFIAYLNGQEVLRVGVGAGRGASASGIRAHEADKFEYFTIKNAAALLRPGPNVLAIEGHNQSRDSSDFSLDPWLGAPSIEPRKPANNGELTELKSGSISGLRMNADYASGSRTLAVLDRHQGKVLWSRPAAYSYRHNAVVIGKGTIFCLDGLTDAKLSYLKRRGLQMDDQPAMYALEARSGKVLWENRQDVFGTWLGYSEEHDVLIEAGSHSRDRAKDEVERGLAAYRGADGKLLWRIDAKYEGPCLLHHDTIITQGAAYDLLTGKRRMRRHPLTGAEVPWTYTRNYGCNTAVGSKFLLTFRSAAAGYFDLENDGGTGNLGGFRSGCTSSLIAADGVLNAPDYTHTCTCSYQNQTSLALVHMPDAEVWTFNKVEVGQGPVKRLGINFGAPGDRRADNGTLWLEYPIADSPSPKFSVTLAPTIPRDANDKKAEAVFAGKNFRHHPSRVLKGPLPWVASSGLENLDRVVVSLGKDVETPRPYTVRLVFAEMEASEAPQRVFDVSLQGVKVLDDFNIAQAAGGVQRSVVKEFTGIPARDTLEIALAAQDPKAPGPILSGVEILAEETD